MAATASFTPYATDSRPPREGGRGRYRLVGVSYAESLRRRGFDVAWQVVTENRKRDGGRPATEDEIAGLKAAYHDEYMRRLGDGKPALRPWDKLEDELRRPLKRHEETVPQQSTTERAGTNALIIRHGYIVGEFGETMRPDPTYSVAKSMLSTVALPSLGVTSRTPSMKRTRRNGAMIRGSCAKAGLTLGSEHLPGATPTR